MAQTRNRKAIISLVGSIAGWVLGFLPALWLFGLSIGVGSGDPALQASIFWFLPILVPLVILVVAIISGRQAKREIRQRSEAGGRMATAGLVMGTIGLLVLLILIFIKATTIIYCAQGGICFIG